jgi:hypothetical protein
MTTIRAISCPVKQLLEDDGEAEHNQNKGTSDIDNGGKGFSKRIPSRFEVLIRPSMFSLLTVLPVVEYPTSQSFGPVERQYRSGPVQTSHLTKTK